MGSFKIAGLTVLASAALLAGAMLLMRASGDPQYVEGETSLTAIRDNIAALASTSSAVAMTPEERASIIEHRREFSPANKWFYLSQENGPADIVGNDCTGRVSAIDGTTVTLSTFEGAYDTMCENLGVAALSIFAANESYGPFRAMRTTSANHKDVSFTMTVPPEVASQLVTVDIY